MDITYLCEHPDDDASRPIYITEEWLKKLCFDGIAGGWWRMSIDFEQHYTICINITLDEKHIESDMPTSFEIHYINLNHIQYVHQLQNLYFALTGEELNIKP
jgi:hypothetical protein